MKKTNSLDRCFECKRKKPGIFYVDDMDWWKTTKKLYPVTKTSVILCKRCFINARIKQKLPKIDIKVQRNFRKRCK